MNYSVDKIYSSVPFSETINVERIITIHYFEFASDYVFKGEKHSFWELLYVDKGDVEVMANTTGYKLQHGDIIFHKPNEFHSVFANEEAPNIIVITFVCSSPAMKFFENKITKLTMSTYNLLANLIKEGKNAYANDFGGQYTKLKKNNNSIVGSEQMVQLYLEMFLIQLMREDSPTKNKDRVSVTAKRRVEEDTVNNIIEYMTAHINENLSFDDICHKFYMGKTHLKTIFKYYKGQGVMSYFSFLKIEEAKKLIRLEKNNFTEISQILGFDSVHYFSKCFKKHTGMSPSEYIVSIKSKILL